MAKRGIKKQEHERLDDSTIGRVVELLEQKKPITKKAACEILNINYSTTRLNRIIDDYKDRLLFVETRFKQNKNKPFSDLENKQLIAEYLSGISIAAISNNLYRSSHKVKTQIAKLNLPVSNKKANYFDPELMPDEMVSDTFIEGELVWANRYGVVAEVRKYLGNDTYRLWLFGNNCEFAAQHYTELGKLDILKKYEMKGEEFITTEKSNFAYRIA